MDDIRLDRYRPLRTLDEIAAALRGRKVVQVALRGKFGPYEGGDSCTLWQTLDDGSLFITEFVGATPDYSEDTPGEPAEINFYLELASPKG